MKLIPGPQTPKFIQTLQWIFRPLSYMDECAKRYGDLFTLRLSRDVVIVSNPAALQQIMTGDSKEFEAPGDLNAPFEHTLGKNSLVMLSGARHQRQRQLMMPSFHGERMKAYGDTIADITKQIISEWQIGKPFCVRSSTQVITLRTIVQVVFGVCESANDRKLEQLIGKMLDRTSSPSRVTMLYFPVLRNLFGPLNPWQQFLHLRQEIHDLLQEEIRKRRANPDPSRTDILSLLMSARDEAGQPMTDEELCDELMTLLFAGHETTATALAWALYWIHKTPTVREKLLAELDSLGDNPDPSAIFKLPYLNAVYCETLRIYPVGMLLFPRMAKVPLSMAGYQLEPGTVLMGSVYLAHRREDIYPEPEKFKPERFLERQFSPSEFLPFGGGARRCIGFAFAQFEMKIALAVILSRKELQLVDNGEVRAKRRGLVTAPDRTIRLVVKADRAVKSPILEAVSG